MEISNFDEDQMAKQISLYGIQYQQKIMKIKVFIHGLSGLGIQVAKNVILTSVKQVTIFDPKIVDMTDVGRNFYCHEEHIGKVSIAQACLPQLQKLNPNCLVKQSKFNDIELIAKTYNCIVILDNYNKQYLINLNKACRTNNNNFIFGGNLGLYGYCFVDFGQSHILFDRDGQINNKVHIENITKQLNAVVMASQYTYYEYKAQAFNDGDVIQFKNVQGMTEINGKQLQVKVKNSQSYFIGDTSNFSQYTNGGIAVQVKKQAQQKFNDLQTSLRYPFAPGTKQIPIASLEKVGIPEQLHLIFNAVLDFVAKHNRLPANLNEAEAEELVALVKENQSKKMQIQGETFKVENIDENLIKNVARFANTQISPTCSFWGGIITQQIVKLTGKYTPLRQWLHHQFFEVLPEGAVQRTVNENNRYNDYVVLFGDQFTSKCQNSSSFVVGAGILGTEMVKTMAMMGASTQGGKCFVADGNNINTNDLNQKLFFTNYNLGQNKSQVLCKAAKSFNSKSNFQPIPYNLSKQNSQLWSQKMFKDTNFVIDTSNNQRTNNYIDSQCVTDQKASFYMKTFGKRVYTQSILPFQSCSYSDYPAIQTVPPYNCSQLSTMLNFPYLSIHTIKYAMHLFQKQFIQVSQDLNKVFQHDQFQLIKWFKQMKQNNSTDRVQIVIRLVQIYLSQDYYDCVQLALQLFYKIFYTRINALLKQFPKDYIQQYSQKPFWRHRKRYPQPILFNIQDGIHKAFLHSASNIYAQMLNIPRQSQEQILSIYPTCFIPSQFSKQTSQQICWPILEQKCLNLKPLLNKNYQLQIIKFQQNDLFKNHIQFVCMGTKLRANNFRLEQVTDRRVKDVVRGVRPNNVMNNAMAVGIVALEIIKLLLNKPVNSFRNAQITSTLPWLFLNLQQPIINQDKQFDNIMCGPVKVFPSKFTKWDKIKLKGPMTIAQIKNHFQMAYDVSIDMISFGTSMLFSSFNKKLNKDLINLTVQQAIVQVTKKLINCSIKLLYLEIYGHAKDDENIDCQFPTISYQITPTQQKQQKE